MFRERFLPPKKHKSLAAPRFASHGLQVGLISVLLREFRTVLLLSLLYFLVFVAYAAVKALLIFGTQTPEEQFWSDSGFAAASTATRLRETSRSDGGALAVAWSGSTGHPLRLAAGTRPLPRCWSFLAPARPRCAQWLWCGTRSCWRRCSGSGGLHGTTARPGCRAFATLRGPPSRLRECPAISPAGRVLWPLRGRRRSSGGLGSVARPPPPSPWRPACFMSCACVRVVCPAARIAKNGFLFLRRAGLAHASLRGLVAALGWGSIARAGRLAGWVLAPRRAPLGRGGGSSCSLALFAHVVCQRVDGHACCGLGCNPLGVVVQLLQQRVKQVINRFWPLLSGPAGGCERSGGGRAAGESGLLGAKLARRANNALVAEPGAHPQGPPSGGFGLDARCSRVSMLSLCRKGGKPGARAVRTSGGTAMFDAR